MLKIFKSLLPKTKNTNFTQTKLLQKRFTEFTIPLPQRVYEQWEFSMEVCSELETQAMFCNDEESIINFFNINGPRVPLKVIATIIENITVSQVDLTQKFEKTCAPVIAEYIMKMNKDHSLTYGRLLKDFAFMDINSPMIWNALIHTFKHQRMYRYVPVDIMADTFCNFSLNESSPVEILKTILPILYQHRYRLDQERLDLLVEALERLKMDEFKPQFEKSLEDSKNLNQQDEHH